MVYDNKNHNRGIGDGADRYCKTILLKRIVDHFFVLTRNWFIELNYDNLNCDNNDIVTPMMGFIRHCIESNVLLPGHLDPCIIEEFISRTLTYEESMHYLKYIDPVVYKNVESMDLDDLESFNLLCTGHCTLYHMVREIVINHPLTQKEKKHALMFDFGPIEYENAIEFDTKISEPYELNAEMLKKIFRINDPDPKYKNMWDELINELDDSEMRSMMILFTGSSKIISNTISLHINHHYVNNYQDDNQDNQNNQDNRDNEMKIKFCDIEIQTCFYTGSLNPRIFESHETLNNLKFYFKDHCDFIIG